MVVIPISRHFGANPFHDLQTDFSRQVFSRVVQVGSQSARLRVSFRTLQQRILGSRVLTMQASPWRPASALTSPAATRCSLPYADEITCAACTMASAERSTSSSVVVQFEIDTRST